MKKETKKEKTETKHFSDRYSWADSIMESKTGSIIVGILAIIFGVFFALIQSINDPIPRSEAVAYSGKFEEYKVGKNYCAIVFADGSEYEVYPHTETQEFSDAMNSLKKGTELDILVNPNSDYVVEIMAGSREILNFEQSQAAIDSYDNGYIAIGVFACFAGVFIIIFGLVSSKQKEKEIEKHEKKAKRRENKSADGAIRHADRSTKSRILLEAKVEGYEICYRRVKNVNELVINGLVYDEKKAVIEFPHTLSALVDGHTIEAGLSDDSYSYIMFDEECLTKKQRLI